MCAVAASNPPLEPVDALGERHDARRWLWKHSANARRTDCGRVPTGGLVTLTRGPDSSGLTGLATCGSVWSCPVCSAKILAHRAREIEAALDAWHAMGNSVALLTLTMRHARTHELAPCWDALADAWGAASGGTRRVKAAKLAAGMAGYVRTVESTHGDAGWHPHTHALLFVQGKPTDSAIATLGDAMFEAWARRLAKRGEGLTPVAALGGLNCKLLSLDQAREHAAGYLAKSSYGGSEALRAALELAGSGKRGRSGSRTPWAILDAARGGDAQSIALWHEWERASHGRRAVTWSRDIRALCGLGDEHTDEELLAMVEEANESVCSWPAIDWPAIRAGQHEETLLRIARAMPTRASCFVAVVGFCDLHGLPIPRRTE